MFDLAWYWYVGYFTIGFIGMCLVQYLKGRWEPKNTHDFSRNECYDMASGFTSCFWPIMIVFIVGAVIVAGIGWLLMKLNDACSELGRSHRKEANV